MGVGEGEVEMLYTVQNVHKLYSYTKIHGFENDVYLQYYFSVHITLQVLVKPGHHPKILTERGKKIYNILKYYKL